MELKTMTTQFPVAAGTGRATRVRRGDLVCVVDVEGGQVGDLFAFVDGDEYLSAAHTRTATASLFPRIGDCFVTNRRRPILRLVDDTSPGVHDMLIAACDPARYHNLGAPGHASCAANLQRALADVGVEADTVPQPVNVFMNIPVGDGGALSWLPALSLPGDAVTFEAVMDCILVLSACPMDLNSINGDKPTPLALDVLTSDDTDKEN